MNASACAFSIEEGVYIFGGEDDDGDLLTTIDQYSPRDKKWTLLDVSLPSPLSMQVAYKVSKRKILLFGGVQLQENKHG